jgi:thymidylate kinase
VILIFEGADLVGKSTLAEEFARRMDAPVIKIRWDLMHPEAETRAFAKATIALLVGLRPDAVFDRCYFSFYAYGPVLGYDVAYMPALIKRFERVENARLVMLTAREEVLRERFAKEPDEWFTIDQIVAANARFPDLIALAPPNLPTLHLDTSEHSVDECIETVQRWLDSAVP